MTSKPLHVFLLPSQNKNNKYLELLKDGLRRSDSNLYIHELSEDNLANIFSELKSYNYRESANILHIQWPTILYGSKYWLKSIYLIIRNYFILIILKMAYSFKVVWTVHNFYAHDYPHPWADRIGTRLVLNQSNHIICQQEKTTDEFKKLYPSKRVTYIPHGNYIDSYGVVTSRDVEFRRSLGFKDDDVVLVSLGAIAPYKLNEKLITAVQKAQEKSKHLRLLIAGKGQTSYVERLKNLVGTETIIENRFIPDKDIPKYMSCADYSIFYYDMSEMTSGAMMLSLSYGVPVIIRDIPAAEVINHENGHVFKSDEQLLKILENLPSEHSEKGKINAIMKSVKDYSWTIISSKTLGVYRE